MRGLLQRGVTWAVLGGQGWVDGWCTLFLSRLKLTALECDRDTGNDGGRLDTAVTPSTILYRDNNDHELNGWPAHVGGTHAYHSNIPKGLRR